MIVFKKKTSIGIISTREQKICFTTFYNILQHFRLDDCLRKKPQLASSPQGNKIYHLDLPIVKKTVKTYPVGWFFLVYPEHALQSVKVDELCEKHNTCKPTRYHGILFFFLFGNFFENNFNVM